MEKTFYFIAGRFSPAEMGFTYYENGVSIIEVKATNYNDAEEEVKKFCYMTYGNREEKDMWYGIVAYNWNFKRLRKAEFDLYKGETEDPECENYMYFKLKSAKLYTSPKITISDYKNITDYHVHETEEIKEFFS